MSIPAMDPVRIYIIWHPRFTDGDKYASLIYEKFAGNPGKLNPGGAGVPVFYRCEPRNEAVKEPLEIKLNEADLSIIVPLVDEHLITDLVWRKYLADLKKTVDKNGEDRLAYFYLAPFHDAAMNLSKELSDVNFLQLDLHDAPVSETPDGRIHRLGAQLSTMLTEAVCRLLVTKRLGGDENVTAIPPPISLFVSHAKADGVQIGKRIRDEIYQIGQLKAFFDENDLAVGFPWKQSLIDSAGKKTAALIAVVTDAYASRPWCLREIREARNPTPVDPGDKTIWRLNPVIAVDALDSEPTHCISELGGAPVRRYHSDRIPELLDAVLHEVLRCEFNLQRAMVLDRLIKEENHVILNTIPNCRELAAILGEVKHDVEKVILPDPGLTVQEKMEWSGLIKGMEITFSTYEDEEASYGE